MGKRYYLTEAQFPALIAAAYDLSGPQGLGFLHATAGPIDQETLDGVMAFHAKYKQGIDMDYVCGRAVKMHTRMEGGRFYIDADRWYDHSVSQLRDLAARVGLTISDEEESRQAPPASPLRSSDNDSFAGASVAAAIIDSVSIPDSSSSYEGGGGSFAGGGASGSWDSGSSSSGADFSNVSSGSDSTASSGD